MKTVFVICCLCSVFLVARLQIPKNKALNGCGVAGYDIPTVEQCVGEENCCYFNYVDVDNTNITFCAKVPKIVSTKEDYDQIKTKFFGKLRIDETTANITVQCKKNSE